jgi:hypothetical protein
MTVTIVAQLAPVSVPGLFFAGAVVDICCHVFARALARKGTVLLEPSRAWVSSLHSCEFFVVGAKIREAVLVGKVTREWRSLVLA